MKIRAVIVSLLLFTTIVIITNVSQKVNAETPLLDDTPLIEGATGPNDYQFEVLAGDHAVVGVRPRVGDDFNLEVYSDTTCTTLIESSNSVGDMVDFVVLDKTVWASPPNRSAKVTSGTTSYVIEMENDVEDHSIMETWSGSIDTFSGNPVLDLGPSGSWDDNHVYGPTIVHDGTIYHMWYIGDNGVNRRIGYATSLDGISWTKSLSNPVLTPGPSFWDSQNVGHPYVIYNGTTYQMWYGGSDGSKLRIGYATSPNGITWTKHNSNPVLDVGSAGSWDDNIVTGPTVFYDGATYHMWYHGHDGSNYRIGYATSPDGVTWTKSGVNPVLSLGIPGSWDDAHVNEPTVFFNGTIYQMWYRGGDGSNSMIGYATSINGITWTKNPTNPVLDLGPPGYWDDSHIGGPTVLYNGTTYHMWFSGHDGANNRIGYATSTFTDDIIWTKSGLNPVLEEGPAAWDNTIVDSCTVIFDGIIYHMWYSGNDHLSWGDWEVGYANSSDGINWNKYSGNPVLTMSSSPSWDNASVGAPSVLYDGTIYHMWYGGSDGSNNRIGYANSTDGLSWTKYSGNPVLTIGSPGSWEDNMVTAPHVLYNGTTYQMWYHGHDDSNYRIGYATSPDGLSWTRFGANPILDLGSPGSWDDTHVAGPSVIYDGLTYHMWYHGHDGSSIRIGYATSPDGTTWMKSGENPVLGQGPPGSWDDTHVYQVMVLFNGITYQMWYTGNDGSTGRIGYAVSSAFINWTKFSFAEVLDAYEVVDLNAGSTYTITLDVPATADLDFFIFRTTGGRDDAVASSTNTGVGIDESISFTAPTSGDYLLVITNEDGGFGIYNISFIDIPPTITDVTAVPNPQEVFGFVNISANITDDVQLYGAWVQIYDPNGNFVGDFSMLFDQISGRYYWNQAYDLLGTYTFVIRANDTSNNWDSALGSFVIQDTTPPTITDISAIPDPQEVYFSVNTSAIVTDNFQLFGTWIEIYDPDGGLVGNFSMLYDPVYGRYYWNQTYDLLGTYTFTIWANDSSDNWASASDMFVIQDITPPMITDVIAVPDPQEVFGAGNISANITDNYQLYGAWVEVYDPDGGIVGNFTLLYDPITDRYYWNQSYDIVGAYTFTIWANDTSNNWASVSDIFSIQDTTPPVIADVIAIPDPQEVFGAVNISANITDNYQLYGAWVEIYDPEGGFVGNFSLLYDSIDDRFYWNQTYDLLGMYTFTIWANDTSNNWASVTDIFIIQDTTPPTILDITAVPDPQEVFGAVNISANITDNFNLFGVWVEIYDPIGGTVGNFSMFYDPSSSRYYWVQTYDLLGVYTFTIYANDTSDNWESASGSFVIYDTTPPVIIDVTVVPDPQEVFGPVNISANITDNYQLFGVWIEIYDPSASFVGNFSMFYDPINFRYYWNQSYEVLGSFTFTIWANDTSDNWASTSDIFIIQDTTPPVIVDVTAIPDPQEVFGAVNISANITDNYQLFGVWVEIYDPKGGFVGNFSMLYDSINDRFYWDQTHDLLGTYTFMIWANDTSDNWASASDTFFIQDTTPPIITEVTAVPDPQEVFGFVNISVNITDNYQLFGAWAEVYDPFGGFVGKFSMFYDSINNRYFLNQTYDLLGIYTFTIWANDTSDNWASASDIFFIQDTTPPIIVDLTAVPDPQEVFRAVNISANITDNYRLFGEWVGIYDPHGALLGNVSLLYDTVNSRYYWNQVYDLLGTYTFTIWANDTSDNWASESGSFLVHDTTPPKITEIISLPNPQEIFGPVNISANVTDNYQLFGVWIEIFNPDEDFIGNFTMLYDQVNGRYYWAQNYNLLGEYLFTIWANDTSDNWASASETFVIQDTTPPVITNVSSVPDPQKVFGALNVSGTITDNYRLFGAWVDIYDPDGNFIGYFSMIYNSIDERYYWNQIYDIPGAHTFTIWANDTSNNWASTSNLFTIYAPLPPIISNVTAEPYPQIVGEKVTISATVTDEDTDLDNLIVKVNITKPDGKSLGNFTMTYNSTSGRFMYTSNYDLKGTYSFVIWATDLEGNWAKEDDTFKMEPKTEPKEYNWKPIIALIFTIILLILGILVSYNRPLEFTGNLEKDRWYTFLGGVLPFVIAEAITGIISFLTGLLRVPPILGVGMIIDMIILILGIISCVMIFKKGRIQTTIEEEAKPTPPISPKEELPITPPEEGLPNTPSNEELSSSEEEIPPPTPSEET